MIKDDKMTSKTNNKKNQRIVKDLLIQKRQQREPEIIPDHVYPNLLEFNNILQNNDYKVSMPARVWFQLHSNINDVLDKLIAMENLQEQAKHSYLTPVMRALMISSYKIAYPYNTFAFNSMEDEAIGKELLMYPSIKHEEDKKHYTTYQQKYGIKFCSIDMNLNNQIYTDIRTMIESKRKKYGSEKLYYYHKYSENTVLRKYYESNKTIKYIDLKIITLEEMLEISNFEKSIYRFDGKKKLSDEEFRWKGELLLDLFKETPEVRYGDKKFFVKPQYCLISNYIAKEEEESLLNMKDFYKKTNAWELLRKYKTEISQNLDPSLSEEERCNKLRFRFFMMYLRQENRNMPPFHDLYIRSDVEKKQTVIENTVEEQQEPVTPSKMQYKQRVVCERNSQSEIVNNSPPAIVTDCLTMIPLEITLEEITSATDVTLHEMELIQILAQSKEILKVMQEAVKSRFPQNHINLWDERHRRFTFIHLVLHSVKNNPEQLTGLIESLLDEESKANALKLVNDLVEFYQHLDDEEIIIPPTITSTQNFEIPEVQEEVTIETSKDVVLPTANVTHSRPIKVEDLSQNIPKHSQDSDVMILSNKPDLIFDLCSEEDSIIEMLERDDTANNERDRYQRQLNRESQSNESTVASTSPPQDQLPLSDNNSLQENYGLRCAELLKGDKDRVIYDAARAQKRKNEDLSNVTKRRKTKNTRRNPINFIDTEELVGQLPGTNLENNLFHLNDTQFSSRSVDESITHNAFTFNSKERNHLLNNNGATCFIIELQRVTFKRDCKFEIFFHLPQYTIFDVLVKDNDIQNALNLNHGEWQALLDNLYAIGTYEYTHGQVNSNKFSQSGYVLSIVRQLDLYFSTLSQFKSFQIVGNGHDFTTYPLTSIPTNLNTANAIDFDILEMICDYETASN